MKKIKCLGGAQKSVFLVEMDGKKYVKKEFLDKHHYNRAIKTYQLLKNMRLTPKLIKKNSEENYVILEYVPKTLMKWRKKIHKKYKNLPKQAKLKKHNAYWRMSNKIIKGLQKIYSKGIDINDVTEHNILLSKEDNPLFIDFDNNSFNNTACFKNSNCVNGDINTNRNMKMFSGYNQSIKDKLGFDAKQSFFLKTLMKYDVYGTYHHPRFYYDYGKRNTLKRINKFGINFRHYKCLDLGSNLGSMGFEMLCRGAPVITFVEKRKKRCITIEKILQKCFHKNRWNVINADIDELSKKFFKNHGLISCFSVDGWVKDRKSLLKNLNNSGARIILFETNPGQYEESKSVNLSNYKKCFKGKDEEGIRENYAFKIR